MCCLQPQDRPLQELPRAHGLGPTLHRCSPTRPVQTHLPGPGTGLLLCTGATGEDQKPLGPVRAYTLPSDPWVGGLSLQTIAGVHHTTSACLQIHCLVCPHPVLGRQMPNSAYVAGEAALTCHICFLPNLSILLYPIWWKWKHVAFWGGPQLSFPWSPLSKY